MSWDCDKDGHVEVDHDRYCEACTRSLVASDRIGMHIVREPDPEDAGIADLHAWGMGDLNGEHFA